MFKPKVGDLVWIWRFGFSDPEPGFIIGERRIKGPPPTSAEDIKAISENPLLQRVLCQVEYKVLHNEKVSWASASRYEYELTDSELVNVPIEEKAYSIITEWILKNRNPSSDNKD